MCSSQVCGAGRELASVFQCSPFFGIQELCVGVFVRFEKSCLCGYLLGGLAFQKTKKKPNLIQQHFHCKGPQVRGAHFSLFLGPVLRELDLPSKRARTVRGSEAASAG